MSELGMPRSRSSLTDPQQQQPALVHYSSTPPRPYCTTGTPLEKIRAVERRASLSSLEVCTRGFLVARRDYSTGRGV